MKILIAIALSLVATLAIGGSETGTVRFEHGQYASGPNSAGYTFFYLDDGTKVAPPGCATFAGGERWVINNDWPAAKIQMSVLLAAAVSGKRVTIYGSNNCSVWGDTETATNIFIVD
ncbi:hypothetical protein [Methylocaldum gracile]|jgi:hypothetical protein|uniref:hypothetical protein n=1 Tax=unclassified Methylocaldum TaxID=2622260 RepID=UPI0010617423